MNTVFQKEKIEEIREFFGLDGETADIVRMSGGHVNDTFRVDLSGKAAGSYVFQRISPAAYKHPDLIMDNIGAVCRHMEDYISKLPDPDSFPVRLPVYLCAANGKNYYADTDSSYWRVMYRIDAAWFTDLAEAASKAAEPAKFKAVLLANLGKAFGCFTAAMKDMDPSVVIPQNPDFHNTPKRFFALFELADRLGLKDRSIDFIKDRADEASEIWNTYESGLFPCRVTHSDTKLSNVLFKKTTLDPVAVIDLDTIMPGMALYDFADSARSACKDFTKDGKIFFNKNNFEILKDSFLSAANDAFTKEEKDNMLKAAYSISLELASRYLYDYIDGNKYFQISHPHQNFERAVQLIDYAQSMERFL